LKKIFGLSSDSSDVSTVATLDCQGGRMYFPRSQIWRRYLDIESLCCGSCALWAWGVDLGESWRPGYCSIKTMRMPHRSDYKACKAYSPRVINIDWYR
jgi:hypothetical protein